MQTSAHIERYGGGQGAEGGGGVLRLLPGTKLVEMETELDHVLSKEEFEAIERGIQEDFAKGIDTPVEFDEIILRYLGIRTRGREHPRYYQKD